MPGLSSNAFLERLHATARDVVAAHGPSISIDAAAVSRLGAELATKANDVKASSMRHLVLPIKFDSVESEVNFLAMFHMLCMGSGWDQALRERIRRGTAETMQFAALGMHIGGTRIDAEWMQAFGIMQVRCGACMHACGMHACTACGRFRTWLLGVCMGGPWRNAPCYTSCMGEDRSMSPRLLILASCQEAIPCWYLSQIQ